MVLRTLHELDPTEGTVQLVDANAAHAVAHLAGTDVVLIPQPSSDANDPLRWPRWKKIITFINVCAFSFFTNFSIGGLAPAFYGLSLEFQKPTATTTGLVTWAVLVLGLGNFFWVPTAVYFGKRPVFIVASAILCGSNIWAATSKSFGFLLGSRILAAFAGSSTEALGAAIVNDLFFLHERGNMMGAYIIFLSWGNSLGPLVAGFIIEDLGWRWFCWVCTIFTGANFLSVVFLVPETRFIRDVEHSLIGVNAVVKDESTEKPATITMEVAPSIPPNRVPVSTPQKTYVKQLSPFSGTDSTTSYFKLLLRPLPLLAYPAVVWAVLGYSISLAWVIAVSTLNSFVLQAPPYNFSPGINGLINLPAMIGNLFGAFTGGYLMDVYSRRHARSHKGVFFPESRLHLLVVPGLCVPTGLLMFGFGAQKQLSWAVMFVGYGFINVGVTCVANIGMTYVMDSYFPVAAEALLLVNGLKNIVAFGFSYGAVPWVVARGYQQVFGIMTGIFLAVLALAIPLILFGTMIRHFTSSRLRLIL